MSEDIKEILDKAKEISDYGADGKQHTRMFNQFEAKALLDYITNLKEELKSANESITWWTNRFNAVAKENERLNNIIKETIEYIKEYGDTENIFIPTNISHKTSIELLEILDKENK